MNKSVSENEKNKEIKETSEEESFAGYEAMENAEEGLEEDWLSEIGMPPVTVQSPGGFSESICDTTLEGSLKNSYEEKKEFLLREKWYSVTGRKPRNFPNVKPIPDEKTIEFKYFGERKPFAVEKRREEKIMIAAKKMQSLNISYGKVRQEIRLQSLHQGLMCVKFSFDGTYLAFSERTGCVEVRKMSTNKVVSRLKTLEQNLELPIRALVFHPTENEKLFVGGDTGTIQIHDVQSGNVIHGNTGFELINVMDINISGNIIATGGRAGRLHIIDSRTLQPIWTRGCPRPGKEANYSANDDYHTMRIYGLKFHPTEENLFVSGGWDNAVKVWDVRTPGAIRSFCGPAIYGPGLDIADNLLLTASWRAENSLSVWDFATGEFVKQIPIRNKSLKMEGEFIYTAQFFKNFPPIASNNLIAVGGSGFPEMLVINIFTEKVEKYFPSYKAILTLDIFQNLVAYGGKESYLRVAELTAPPSRRW